MAQFSEQECGEGMCAISATGELDLAAIDEFIDVVRDSLSRCHTVEIDLADVSFIDSSGLGALVRLRKEAGSEDASLYLTNVTDATDRLLRLTGLIDFFEIRTSEH